MSDFRAFETCSERSSATKTLSALEGVRLECNAGFTDSSFSKEVDEGNMNHLRTIGVRGIALGTMAPSDQRNRVEKN